jgi:DNA-binding NarL/FixJ family response regulator
MTVLCDACCEARLTAKSDQAERLAERRETIVSMLAAGKPAPFIAAEVGLSTRTIERVKKEMAA